MREEEEPSWFARWEEQLPAPEELMPLSQSLITHDLAVAFDIPSHGGGEGGGGGGGAGGAGGVDGVAGASAREMNGGASSAAGSSGGGGGGGGEEPARTLKRPRLVWTPQLHKRFVDAVAHLGIKNAVPKTIMQLMSVDGLTRENVASHLQKYRLYLKRMQGFGNGAGGAGAGAGGGAGGSHSSGSGTDAATEHLFATGPVPFLPPGRSPAGAGVDPYPPFAPMAAHHHHHPPQIGHFHHPAGRPLGHFGAGPGAGYDHGFLNRAVAVGAPPVGPPGIHRMVGGAAGMGMIAPSSFADELELGSRGGGSGGGRRELTLFPTSGDH